MLPATEFSPVLGNGGYDFLERDAQFLCLDDQLLDFMLAHPILINRPIVVTDDSVKLCRPSETVKELL